MDTAPLLTTLTAIAGAFIAGTFSYLIAKGRTKIEIGQSITIGFKELTDQLQQERKELGSLVASQRAEMAQLQNALRSCEHYIDILEWRLRKANLPIPVFRKHELGQARLSAPDPASGEEDHE